METKSINNMTHTQDLRSKRAEDASTAKKADHVNFTKSADIDSKSSSKTEYNVSLSSEARDLADAHKKAYDIANETSGIREDKVAALKQKIQNGEYKIDPEKIADGIIRESLLDKIALEMHDNG